MNTAKKFTGLVLATAAAGLFATAALTNVASADEGKVHCMGVNGCKGKSACQTADSSCKGHNSCKGKGWLEMTKKECEDKGGKVKES